MPAATAMRIVFALFAVQLLGIVGLLFAGGILLLWVAWKMWRELRGQRHANVGALSAPPKTFAQAAWQIVLADVSMSLDNVLAVAGTARHHLWVLGVGLSLSVALMGVAATMIAGALRRYPWISYLGLWLIAWVAVSMIWSGAWDAWHMANAKPA